jgi:tetratricopeptide (TPR) repeat protein
MRKFLVALLVSGAFLQPVRAADPNPNDLTYRYVQAGDYTKALDAARDAVHKAPNDRKTQYNYQGLYLLNMALEKRPGNAELFAGIGSRFQLAAYHIGPKSSDRRAWFRIAERAFEQAVKDKPYSSEYRLHLASVLASQEKIPQATAQVNEVLRMEPDNRAAQYARNKLRAAQNDIAGSLRSWLRAYCPLR